MIHNWSNCANVCVRSALSTVSQFEMANSSETVVNRALKAASARRCSLSSAVEVLAIASSVFHGMTTTRVTRLREGCIAAIASQPEANLEAPRLIMIHKRLNQSPYQLDPLDGVEDVPQVCELAQGLLKV